MEYRDKKPIYLQIVDAIIMDIIKGEIVLGEKFLTIKEMSLKFQVNPNTIQNVFKELESLNLVTSKRGLGIYLSEDSLVVESIKTQFIEQKIKIFLEDMKNIGIEKHELINRLRKEG